VKFIIIVVVVVVVVVVVLQRPVAHTAERLLFVP
jgi:hypothetical protein